MFVWIAFGPLPFVVILSVSRLELGARTIQRKCQNTVSRRQALAPVSVSRMNTRALLCDGSPSPARASVSNILGLGSTPPVVTPGGMATDIRTKNPACTGQKQPNRTETAERLPWRKRLCIAWHYTEAATAP